MKLECESGWMAEDATEVDIRANIGVEDFSILSIDDQTYMQCARRDPPFEFAIEYQGGSIDEHYTAEDEPVTFDRVLAAFLKYLRGDDSWRADFRWEKMDLS